VDYLVTADRAGLEIPDGSYGQKSGIPYFGDSPLASQIGGSFRARSVTIIEFSDGVFYKKIGSLVVPSIDAVVGKIWAIDFVIAVSDAGLGSLTDPSNKIYFGTKLGTGAPSLANGSWIDISPAKLYELRKGIGSISLAGSAGLLRPSIQLMTINGGAESATELINADNFVSAPTILPFKITTIETPMVNTAPIDTETVLEFYLLADINDGSGGMMNAFDIDLNVSLTNIVTGALSA